MTLSRILSVILITVISAAASRAQTTGTDSVIPRRPAAAIAASAGTALVANAVLTETLKRAIHERRPDGSAHNSWPSRHTSWAFTIATAGAHELYTYSGLWVPALHTVANGIGIQRVLSNRHYPKDVLGGTAVGIISGEIGQFIGRVMYPSAYRAPARVSADWLPSVDAATTAIFPVSRPAAGLRALTGIMTAVRTSLPVSECFGAAVQADLRSVPVMAHGGFVHMANAFALSAGAMTSRSADGPVAPYARLLAGVARNFHMGAVPHGAWGFTLQADAGISWQLTPGLAIGADAGYLCWHIKRNLSAVTLSLSTRATF